VIIKRLILENFQGIKELDIAFNGVDTDIYGDNATGKTTVANAITWLLFDQSSHDVKNYNPKTVNVHKTNHRAVGIFFDEDNEKEITLEKIYHETYKSKKGSLEKFFSGNTTEYFVNNIECKQSDYNNKIESFFGQKKEVLKMLMLPTYFLEAMKWQNRRDILLKMCGDIDDATVLSNITDFDDDEIADLKFYMEKLTITDLLKRAKQNKNDIKKELTDIPARIDEIEKSIQECPEIKEIKNDIFDTEELIEELKSHENDDLKRDLEITKLKSKRSEHLFDKKAIEKEIANYKERIKGNKEISRKIEEMLKNARAKQWEADSAICPTCHRELPADEVENERKEFENNKAEQIKRLEKNLSELEEKNNSFRDEIKDKENQLRDVEKKIKEINIDIESENNKSEDGTDEIKLNELKKHLDDLKLLREIYNQNEKLRIRILSLKDDERILNTKYERQEWIIYACQTFINTKAKLLSERINNMFNYCSFQLFSIQVNGEVKEQCEVLIPSPTGNMIPYNMANNAAKINAGLEIIRKLDRYYGTDMPVIIDNAESITHLGIIYGQIIRLVVSAKDPYLRVVNYD
jgi:DNA repair exonuclease SbcCD ATPase subunit